MIDRVDPQTTDAFSKNISDEEFLAGLNAALIEFEADQYRDLSESLPTLHVIGPPRSGTTLLSQLVATHLDVGYISNLVAAFWRAPVTGIKLANKLLFEHKPASLESTFGRTHGIAEPHEFGYFWSHHLAYREMRAPGVGDRPAIDWDNLRRVLINISAAFGKPVIFKNFMVVWHMKSMSAALPKTCYVRLRRDPLDNALSLLRMREEFLGDKSSWASLKPAEFAELRERPYWEQVAGQVHFLNRAIDDATSQVDDRCVLEIELADLCREPGAALNRIVELLRGHGANLDSVPVRPDALALRRPDATVEDRRRVAQALATLASS